MTIDITTHALISITEVCATLVALALIIKHGTIKRTSRPAAYRAAWEAWQVVSERAIEKGQPVPLPPGEHGKR